MMPIAHFEEKYSITSKGQVLSSINNNWLALRKNPNGYMIAVLSNGRGGNKQISVHRLVALHFLPNPYGHDYVNHKDGNKENNDVSNLEWCSSTQNTEHALRTNLRSGYMSADDKIKHMYRVLGGTQVKDLAIELCRRPETLHKMLRETAKKQGLHQEWTTKMRENRINAAIKNLERINN